MDDFEELKIFGLYFEDLRKRRITISEIVNL